MQQSEKFEQWCLLELMGRQRIAGLVSERVIAGTGFLEVRVPETTKNPKFTRFIHPNSLYAINPIDETTARMYVENLNVKPIDSWDIGAFMKKIEENQLALAAKRDEYPEEARQYEEEVSDDYGDEEDED